MHDSVSLVTGVHGTVATILICALLFIDEAGVPLPFAPNEVLLIAAGLLIGGGGLSPWIFFPLAFLAMGGGVATGYAWANAIGPQQLRRVAQRLRAAKHYDRAVGRLQETNSLGIFVARMLPGVRVYATLVSGATNFDRRRFFVGALPAMMTWCVGFTLLGVVVGVPAEHAYHRVEHLLVSGALFIALGVAGLLAARHIPSTDDRSLPVLQNVPAGGRLALALGLDLGIVASMFVGAERIARYVLHAGPDGYNDVALLVGAVVLGYIVLSRRGPGGTVGEQLLDVTYRKVVIPLHLPAHGHDAADGGNGSPRREDAPAEETATPADQPRKEPAQPRL